MDKETKEKVANMIRLARKAHAVAVGRLAVERSVKQGRTSLIFAGKSDNNFMRKHAPKYEALGIQISQLFNDSELADIFGRQKLTLMAITNENFTRGIKEILGR